MRFRLLVASCLAVAPIASLSGTAFADPPGATALPVQVVSVKSDDAEDQAEALTATLRSTVRLAKGWSLAEGDFSLEVLTLGLKCSDAPDPTCQAKIADQIKSDRYIWGTLHRIKGTKQVSAELHLWLRGQGPQVTSVTYSDNLTVPGDESLRRLVEDAFLKLSGGPPKGTVKIKSSLENGELIVDGQPSGTVHGGQATLQLPPGEHKIEVRSPTAKETGAVVVRPNQSLEISLGADAAPTAAPPATSEPAPEPPAADKSWKRTAGLVTLGVGGAFIVGGVYSMLKVNSIQTDDSFDAYRRGFRAGTDICDAADQGRLSPVPGAASPGDARDFCSSGRTFQTLQYVFLGLGIVTAGAGAYLLVSDKGSKQETASSRSIQVLPAVGPGAGRVDIRLAF